MILGRQDLTACKECLVLLHDYLTMHNYKSCKENLPLSVLRFLLKIVNFIVVLSKSKAFKIFLFFLYLYVFPELFFPPQENEMPALNQFDV